MYVHSIITNMEYNVISLVHYISHWLYDIKVHDIYTYIATNTSIGYKLYDII